MFKLSKTLFWIYVLIAIPALAQKIKGTFPAYANQSIKLEAFLGFKTYLVASTTVNSEGLFELSFTQKDYGMAYLMGSDNKPFFLILDKEGAELIGEYTLGFPQGVKMLAGKQNQQFVSYATAHPRREQALTAWDYLEKIYISDSLFTKEKKIQKTIAAEKIRIVNEDNAYLNELAPESFVRWYLPVRKLVSSVSTVAQYRVKELPSTIEAFRKLDYTDEKLYRSGLFKDVFESHFWLIENSGRSLDSVFAEMKVSLDVIIANLTKNEKKLNEVSDFLFDLLERHSLFQASEYLALKILNEVSCTINSDLAKQLETYRAMKKGNVAPDINFPEACYQKGQPVVAKKLAEIKSKYTLVVFGASWCPKCKEELPEIARLYEKWHAREVEVIFVSLDEEQSAFHEFADHFPFISLCDFKKWNSPIANNYYVFGTPTLFLLDNKREIILRPNSVKQMDAWVDWYLKQ